MTPHFSFFSLLFFSLKHTQTLSGNFLPPSLPHHICYLTQTLSLLQEKVIVSPILNSNRTTILITFQKRTTLQTNSINNQ